MGDSALKIGEGDQGPRRSPADPFPWTLDVALSGGGLRASAYTLGALLYLVHSGLNEKIKNISSVSGGSITNAFIACECEDFSKPIDFSAFLKVVRPLATKIAFNGLLQRWQSWLWGIAVAVIALVLLVCLLVLACALVGSWLVARGLLEPPELVTYSPPVLVLAILLLVLPVYWRTSPDKWLEAILPRCLQSWSWCIAVAIGALALFATGTFFYSWLAVLVSNWPRILEITLFLLIVLTLLLYFRSWPIDKWMETILPSDRNLGTLSNRPIDHIFCATDLMFGQPFFFSTADGGRMFSLLYGRADAPGVPVIRAVRASAAFPPAIPPVSLDVETMWLSGLDLKTRTGPLRLWLTDGGAFNNHATEWHDLRRELWFVQTEFFSRSNRKHLNQDTGTWHRKRYGQVQLVVDASQAADVNLVDRLRLPIIGFVLYVLRTMSVMYGSTLAGRSGWSERAASWRIRGYPWKWLARYSASEKLHHFFKHHSAPYDPKDDEDAEFQGALRLFVPLGRRFDNIETFWKLVPQPADLELRHRWNEQKYLAGQNMDFYWPLTGDAKLVKVPTTFRKIGRDPTLKLIIEGYLKTREVLFWSLGFEGPSIPDRSTFESLLNEGE